MQTGLSTRRQLAGFALALVGGPLLLLPLKTFHGPDTITTEVLSYQLLVVIVALVGGIWPALFAAILSGVTLDLAFIEPYRQITIADPVHLLTILLHVAIAVLVSFVVGRAARTHRELEETASEIEPLRGSDRLRGALLSALSHDLRRPLAAATTAIGGLRSAGPTLSTRDREELLETAEESLAALSTLVTDLLDVTRLQSGVLTAAEIPTDPADSILLAIDELELGPGAVELALGHGAAQALGDPVLLQRVLVNLLANAVQHSPPDARVRIETEASHGRVRIRVIDHGPGIPADRREDVFVPFQRLGDTDNTAGLGLGLALSRGFAEAMHGGLAPEATPGGGLTMLVSLPAASDGEGAS